MNQVSCPVCASAQFSVEGAAGSGAEGPEWVAQCRRCDFKMKVVALGAVAEKRDEKAERRLQEAECPFCGQKGASPEFRCHLTSGEGYDIVTCRHCDQPFKEAIGL